MFFSLIPIIQVSSIQEKKKKKTTFWASQLLSHQPVSFGPVKPCDCYALVRINNSCCFVRSGVWTKNKQGQLLLMRLGCFVDFEDGAHFGKFKSKLVELFSNCSIFYLLLL